MEEREGRKDAKEKKTQQTRKGNIHTDVIQALLYIRYQLP